MNSLYKYILSLLPVLLVGLISCEDTLLYDAADIPEGESIVTATIDFHQFDKTNIGSRAAGDSYDLIRNLWILVYSSDGTDLLETKKVDITSPVKEKTEAKFHIDFGRYQIYAVANIDGFDPSEVPTVEDLKSFRLDWKQPDEDGNIGKNDEMLGVFAKENTESDGTNTIIVNRKTVNITAQLIRAASKVTVAYDGSALEEGVNVYIRSLSIKRIPMGCYLGNQSMVTDPDSLIGDGGTIVYYDGTSYDSNTPTLLNKNRPFFPAKDTVDEDGNPAWSDDPHAHTSPSSLFFYENLQGIKDITQEPRFDKRQKDDNKDGQLDYLFPYTELPCATYIEVDARWESTNPKFPGLTDLKYRFMLGQNVIDDYNVWRNCHYKLTLHLSGYAADPDWRIAYERMLSVTPAYEVDYRGMHFKPDPTKANLGNEFGRQEVITVNSYKFPEGSPGETRYAVDYEVQFQDENGNPFPGNQKPDWLIFNPISQTETEKNQGITRYEFGFINEPTTVNMNTKLAENSKNPYSNKDLSDGLKNTANCYIVDRSGTYTFPLVYGNAITNGNVYTDSYSNLKNGNTEYIGDRPINNLVNYLNKDISSPYIVDDIKKYKTDFNTENLEPWVIWEDAPFFPYYKAITGLEYDKNLYGGKGGIRLTISDGNIQEGNMVIGIKNLADGKIMWSWHIWVTAINYDDEHLATLTNHDGNQFQIMPVNLGWCSNGTPVKYYSRKACKVKFTQKEKGADQTVPYAQTIDIVQHPFIAVPQGNSTYYQWGRKDPFFGTNESYKNLTWYEEKINEWDVRYLEFGNATHHLNGSANLYQPYNYKNEDLDEPRGNPSKRALTKDILHELIQNPIMFNNPRRKDYNPGKFDPKESTDSIYSNLWRGDIKTVYDPCPAGFQVSPYDTFTGFTYNGRDVEHAESGDSDIPQGSPTPFPTYENAWYNVSPDNILEELRENYGYKSGVFGLYTDKTKLEPLSFTDNGYLDYASVEVYWVKNHGYIWLARNTSDVLSPFLKYCRNEKKDFLDADNNLDQDIPMGLVGPITEFFTSNGMPVRPTRRVIK